MTTAHQLINQDSGKVEWYTPLKIIEAAREVMGSIDLDPASCAAANKSVKATKYFTAEDDGIEQSWSGNVWLNHPFGRQSNPLWIKKLIREYRYGKVEQAICITFASMSAAWLRPLLFHPMCFPFRRVNYLNPDGTVARGVTKGSVITYLGPNFMRFQEVFYLEQRIGVVKR